MFHLHASVQFCVSAPRYINKISIKTILEVLEYGSRYQMDAWIHPKHPLGLVHQITSLQLVQYHYISDRDTNDSCENLDDIYDLSSCVEQSEPLLTSRNQWGQAS